MANDMTTKVTILGDASNLTKATKKASGDLHKMTRNIKSMSSSLRGGLATLGLAISFSAIKTNLERATKAAIDDAKSQALLQKQLTNTVHATKEQSAAVEDAITKMSIMSAIPDDEIRPAFATLLRSTKSVTKATKLSNLALDVAAGTGKDVGTVAKALSKAYAGNTGSLSKLGINVKKGSNWMKELKKQFKGMAEVQARQDPIKRLQTTFGELQEKMGNGFIPVLNKVADWFDANYENIAKFFKDAWNSDAMTSVKDALWSIWTDVLKPFIDWVSSKDVQTAIGDLFTSLGNVIRSIGDFAASDLGKKLGKLVDPLILNSLQILATTLDAIAGALDRISGKPIPLTQANAKATTMINPYSSYLGSQKLSSGQVLDRTYGNMSSVGGTKNTTVNVYVTKTDPKAVLNELNKYLKGTGQGRIQTTWY